MRIPFIHMGHADPCLKICRQVLLESLPGCPRISTHRLLYAFSNGFGYGSYQEIEHALASPDHDPGQTISRVEMERSLYRSFEKALNLVYRYEYPRSSNNDALIADMASKALALMDTAAAGRASTQSPAKPQPSSGSSSEQVLDAILASDEDDRPNVAFNVYTPPEVLRMLATDAAEPPVLSSLAVRDDFGRPEEELVRIGRLLRGAVYTAWTTTAAWITSSGVTTSSISAIPRSNGESSERR